MSTNYLYFSIIAKHFNHLSMCLHYKEQITLLDNRYKRFYIYIVRTSDKCYKVHVTYNYRIFSLSFRSSITLVEFLQKLDQGEFKFYVGK